MKGSENNTIRCNVIALTCPRHRWYSYPPPPPHTHVSRHRWCSEPPSCSRITGIADAHTSPSYSIIPGFAFASPPPPLHTHVSPGLSITRQLRATMGARWCSERTSARRSPALVVKSFSRTSSKLPQMPHSRPAHVSGTHTVAVVFPSKFTDAPNDVSRRTSRPLLMTLDWRTRFRGSDAFTPFICK